MSDDTYLVWSIEHNAWWKPGGWGYCTGLRGAGHFTREQALEICGNALGTAPHIGMIAEVPVRLADVQEFLKDRTVPECVYKSRNE